MTAEYFRAWLRPEESTARLRYLRGLQLFLATALFQVFLLPRGQGFRRSLHYAGELLDAGQCPMVFPEGRRFVDGMREFQAGIGLMAVRLGAAVVPLHHRGLESVLPPEARWPTRGAVTVRIGAPLRFSADADPAAVAGEIEAAVRSLSGTTGGPEGRTGTIAPRNEGGDR